MKEVTLYGKSIKLSAGNVQFLPRLYKMPGSAIDYVEQFKTLAKIANMHTLNLAP